MISMAHSSQAKITESLRIAAIAALLLLVGMLPLTAQAKESDRSQPVELSSKSFDALAKPNGVSHLNGDVIMSQGTLKTTGASATIYFDADSRVSRVVLTGSPAHIRQIDDNGNQIKGHAGTIDYDIPKAIATLTGTPAHVDQQGRGSATGNTLVYNTETSAMTAQSHGDNRVHLTFQPRQAAKPETPDHADHPDKH